MKVRVTKRAQAQIDRIAAWWDDNRTLAPEAFDEELSEAFSLLSIEPGIGAPRDQCTYRRGEAFASRPDSLLSLLPCPGRRGSCAAHLAHESRERSQAVGRPDQQWRRMTAAAWSSSQGPPGLAAALSPDPAPLPRKLVAVNLRCSVGPRRPVHSEAGTPPPTRRSSWCRKHVERVPVRGGRSSHNPATARPR